MELDDLKLAWAELGQRTATIEGIVLRDSRVRRLETLRRPLQLLGAGRSCRACSGS